MRFVQLLIFTATWLYPLSWLMGQHPVNTLTHLHPAGNVSVIKLPGELLFTDPATGTPLYKIPVPGNHANSYVQFSPDGRLLVSSGTDGFTRLFQVSEDTCRQLLLLPFTTELAEFSPAGETLFLIHSRSFWNAKLSAYAVPIGREEATRKVPAQVNALAISPDGTRLGISAGTTIQLLHASTLKTDTVYWQVERQRNLRFNPTIQGQCATITHKNTIQIRDLAFDLVLTEIDGHAAEIAWVAYHPEGKLLASADVAGNGYIWSLAEKKCLGKFQSILQPPVYDRAGNLRVFTGTEWESINPVVPAENNLQDTLTRSSYFVEKKLKKWEILPMPIIAYTPETSLLIGASANVLFYPDPRKDSLAYLRPSIISPVISYAVNGRQLHTGIGIDLFPRGWHLANTIAYTRNAKNYFFDIGRMAHKNTRQAYTTDIFSWNGSITRIIRKRLYAGIGYHFRIDQPLHFAEEIVQAPGANGGRLVGAGAILQFDQRNSVLFPSSGSWVGVEYYRYSRSFQSDYQYNELRLDYRKYFPLSLIRRGSVLAVQGFFHATWDGEVPFYQLPHITSDRALRGVWRNLYVNKQALSVQAEFRSFLSPGDSRFGYVVFAGLADTADNFFREYDPDIKVVYGAGWRQQLVPKLRLDSRIDIAFTNRGNIGVWGGVGVAF